MKPVFQTKFGGSDALLMEQGNCLQACLASLLEIPLEEAFDIRPYPDGEWQILLDDWFGRFGLYFLSVEYNAGIYYPAYTLLGGLHRPTGIPHVIVCKDGQFVHDPIPGGGRRC